LGMDRILDVPAALPGEHPAVPADEDHQLAPDLLEAPPRRLHPDAAALGIARRDVAPDEVTLVLTGEDPAAERHLVAQLVEHVSMLRETEGRLSRALANDPGAIVL